MSGRHAVAGVVSLLAMFLLIAFCLWDINPANWPPPARVMTLFFWLLFTLPFSLAVADTPRRDR